MSLLDLFKKQPDPPSPSKPAVIVEFKRVDVGVNAQLTDYQGSDMEQLEDALMDALGDNNAGDFWENEFLPDVARSHFIGENTDAMFRAMKPVLRASPLGRKARVLFRQGPEGSPETEVHIDE